MDKAKARIVWEALQDCPETTCELWAWLQPRLPPTATPRPNTPRATSFGLACISHPILIDDMLRDPDLLLLLAKIRIAQT